MGILTSLFFGGIAYILCGLWQGKQRIKNQIKYIKQQRRQQKEMKRIQKEAEIEFYKRWKQLGK